MYNAIWTDAADFKNRGGWFLDKQFISTMGSSYLLATGMGKPVADAEFSLNIPAAGTYRLWVRSRNWLKEAAPGTFILKIGNESSPVFGKQDYDEWIWEDGGSYSLNAGESVVVLHDLTGYWGRISAFVLSDDPTFVPSTDIETMRKQKYMIRGTDGTPELDGYWQVIVAGAGIAGCCAAIASARGGAKTLLIDERDAPGGNGLLGVPVNGAGDMNPDSRESGIVDEITRVQTTYKLTLSQALRHLIESEENLTYIPDKVLVAVDVKDDLIRGITATDAITDIRYTYEAGIFCDCTGDAHLGVLAGAKYRRGRESRAEFDEYFAPEKADGLLMSGVVFREAFLFHASDTGSPITFTPPSWAYSFPEYNRAVCCVSAYDFNQGTWWHEHHGNIDEYVNPEQGRDDLLRIVLGFWDYVKNIWAFRDNAASYALDRIAVTLAKRESNRLMGDYILTQKDVENGAHFPDAVSMGGWPIDVHNHKGIFAKDGPYESSKCVYPYEIPYRCLYSANIGNLLMAGRNVSVTHVALGTVRVQGTLGSLGQAAGIAAALCAKNGDLPRVYSSEKLPVLLNECFGADLYYPGLVWQDSRDILPHAINLQASSISPYREVTSKNLKVSSHVTAAQTRCVIFPVGLYRRIESISIPVSSKIPCSQYNISVTLESSRTRDFAEPEMLLEKDLAAVFGEDMVFSPAGDTWYGGQYGKGISINIAVNKDLTDRYVRLTVLGEDGLYFSLQDPEKFQDMQGLVLVNGEWVSDYPPAFTLSNPMLLPGDSDADKLYTVENIRNGVNRIVKNSQNMWMSNPSQILPQTIHADFATGELIDTVELIFDTDLHTSPKAFKQGVPPFNVITDYSVKAFDGTNWIEIIRCEGNIFRQRIHKIEPVKVSKLRFTALKTGGDLAARLFCMRAYKK
ncbi:MAG: FAD-dependent oxidoreductase [Saccharofermentanales bacterium]